MYRSIGFLESEEALGGVDKDFRELVRSTYYIPGFGSFGVSCSGHPCAKESTNFYPRPFGDLGFAALPEMNHIHELLTLLHEQLATDPEAIMILDSARGAPIDWDRYHPEINLRQYTRALTKTGLYVIYFKILLGDNKALANVEDSCYGSIPLAGNEITFEKCQRRYEEIRGFWKNLETKVKTYNSEHRFLAPNFKKEEFD